MPDNKHSNQDRKRVSFEELAHSNALVVEALVGILSEKGFIAREDLIGRVKQLRGETNVQPSERTGGQVAVSRDDLISSNSFVAELSLDILVDKSFLNTEEMLELKTRMKERTKKLLLLQ